jgi:ABC-type branched-subunit amino acid transport system substrate-binding protein
MLWPVCVGGQYLDKRQTPLRYEGPGREDAEPADLAEVPVGFFGPDDAAHELGGSIYMGLALAVEDANANGGYKGKPFRLISRWTDNPWRGGASAVVKLAYVDRVCAIFGGIDGATTHLAEQVVAKALLPLIDPASWDESVNQANVPWMFSCAPGGVELAQRMLAAMGGAEFTLVAGTDHDSRYLAGEVLKAAGGRVARRVDVAAGAKEPGQAVDGPVMLVAGALETRALAEGLRAGTRVVAGPCGRSRVCKGLRVDSPVLHAPDAVLTGRLEKRFSQAADDFSLLAYDAGRLAVQAVREAGMNRALIRDRLAVHFGPRGRHNKDSQ